MKSVRFTEKSGDNKMAATDKNLFKQSEAGGRKRPRTRSLQKAESSTIRLLVMGGSHGGLVALQTIIKKLSGKFRLPVAVVLHRQEVFKSNLAALLQAHARQEVVEAEDKLLIEQGKIYVAPAGFHLLVNKNHFELSLDAPVHFARPSIDVLFDSAAFVKNGSLAAILLSGSGTDGIKGLIEVKKRGGMTIVQAPDSAEDPALPEAALKTMNPDLVLPLGRIADHLNGMALANAK